MRTLGKRNWLTPIMAGLIATAWIALFVWSMSPYSRYLHHATWTADGLAGVICNVVPGGSLLLPASLYVGGWLLMSAAMMLPTVLPLLWRFDRLTAARGDGTSLIVHLVAGYLLVWLGFGLAAHLLDALIHTLAWRSVWVIGHAWVIAATVLAGAGLFQFSALKYHCLSRCRTPLSFIIKHWHGVSPRAEAFRLGVDHGVFCVGCCWAIMLLMFIVGTGNVGWMLALGGLMAAEKAMPWGHHLSVPLGLALVAAATAVAAVNLGA